MLIVTKPFRYSTRALKVGDEFVAKSNRDRRIMLAIGKVRLAPDTKPERAKVVEAKVEEQPTVVEAKVEEQPAVVEAKVEEQPTVVEAKVEEQPAAKERPAAVKTEDESTAVEESKATKKPGRPKKD